jgi:hypothetical protein
MLKTQLNVYLRASTEIRRGRSSRKPIVFRIKIIKGYCSQGVTKRSKISFIEEERGERG